MGLTATTLRCWLMLLAVFFLPAVHGRSYHGLDPYEQLLGDGPSSRRQQDDDAMQRRLSAATSLNHMLSSLLPQLSGGFPPLESPLRPRPRPFLYNDLQDAGISPEDEAIYSAHGPTQLGRGLERTVMEASYSNYHHEVCPTRKEWNSLPRTVDVNGNNVTIDNINRDQQYYSYQCESPCKACKGVSGRSMCKMRFTYVKMWHWKEYDGRLDHQLTWDYVEVPSHCACELFPDDIRHNQCREG